MTPAELQALQSELGLSDRKMAAALGVTRQTWANWKTGRSGSKRGHLPGIVCTGLRALRDLRRIDPANPAIPQALRAARPGPAWHSMAAAAMRRAPANENTQPERRDY